MNSRLKQVRVKVNKTQTEFGNLFGVSRDAIASYERGRVIPSDTFIQLLCAKLSIDENWLRTGKGPMYAESESSTLTQVTNLLNLDDTEQKFLAAYLNLPPEVKKHFKNACRQIAEFYESENEISATLAARPLANDKRLTRAEKEAIMKRQLDAGEKAIMSSVSIGTNGIVG